MNERIEELALQSGYLPDSFGPEFNQYTQLLIEEILSTIQDAPIHNCYTTFDKSVAQGTKHDIIKFIKLKLQ